MSNEIPLSEVLAEISRELKKAAQRSSDDGDATMQFEECEIEFAVKVEKDVNGILKVWMLNIGGGAKKTESNTIKIKFKKIDDNLIQASSTDLNIKAEEIKRQ